MLSKNSHFGHSVFNTWKHFFLLWGGEIKEQRFGLMSVHENLCPQCMCMNTHCSLCFFAFLKHFKLCTDFASVARGDGSVSTDMPEAQLLIPAVPQVMTSSRCHASLKSFAWFFFFPVSSGMMHKYPSVQAFHLLPLCMSRG